MKLPVLSVVIPVHNESANIAPFYGALQPIVASLTGGDYEIIYVDDGSSDTTAADVRQLRVSDTKVRLLALSRNWGKEVALAAGIAQASGAATLLIDGDGQHPVARIPEFVAAWQAGAQVVIGVRRANQNEGFVKKYGSKLFYVFFNHVSGTRLIAGSSDFRLIDQVVRREFTAFREPDSITRGLIDWLGFRKTYINYTAHARMAGTSPYKTSQLIKLAANSFISLSPVPLYAFGYVGVIITIGACLLGVAILVEQVILADPFGWNFTGTAMLSILLLFLVGIILVAQGVMALYISHIHTQSKGRPLYIIDPTGSAGLEL